MYDIALKNNDYQLNFVIFFSLHHLSTPFTRLCWAICRPLRSNFLPQCPCCLVFRYYDRLLDTDMDGSLRKRGRERESQAEIGSPPSMKFVIYPYLSRPCRRGEGRGWGWVGLMCDWTSCSHMDSLRSRMKGIINLAELRTLIKRSRCKHTKYPVHLPLEAYDTFSFTKCGQISLQFSSQIHTNYITNSRHRVRESTPTRPFRQHLLLEPSQPIKQTEPENGNINSALSIKNRQQSKRHTSHTS